MLVLQWILLPFVVVLYVAFLVLSFRDIYLPQYILAGLFGGLSLSALWSMGMLSECMLMETAALVLLIVQLVCWRRHPPRVV
jgi:hypothetical protein